MSRRPKAQSRFPEGQRAYPTQAGHSVVCDVSLLPSCRVKKLVTANGFFLIDEGSATIGKINKYLPDSRCVQRWVNQPTGKEFEAEVVLVYDDRGLFAFIPTELLELTL